MDTSQQAQWLIERHAEICNQLVVERIRSNDACLGIGVVAIGLSTLAILAADYHYLSGAMWCLVEGWIVFTMYTAWRVHDRVISLPTEHLIRELRCMEDIFHASSCIHHMRR